MRMREDFPAFSANYCFTSTNRGFGRQPAVGRNCKTDHGWLPLKLVKIEINGGAT